MFQVVVVEVYWSFLAFNCFAILSARFWLSPTQVVCFKLPFGRGGSLPLSGKSQALHRLDSVNRRLPFFLGYFFLSFGRRRLFFRVLVGILKIQNGAGIIKQNLVYRH